MTMHSSWEPEVMSTKYGIQVFWAHEAKSVSCFTPYKDQPASIVCSDDFETVEIQFTRDHSSADQLRHALRWMVDQEEGFPDGTAWD